MFIYTMYYIIYIIYYLPNIYKIFILCLGRSSAFNFSLMVPIIAHHCLHVLTTLLSKSEIKQMFLETKWNYYSIPLQNHCLCSCGIWFALLFANFVAAQLKLSVIKAEKARNAYVWGQQQQNKWGPLDLKWLRVATLRFLFPLLLNTGFPFLTFLKSSFFLNLVLFLASIKLSCYTPALCGHIAPLFALRSAASDAEPSRMLAILYNRCLFFSSLPIKSFLLSFLDSPMFSLICIFLSFVWF